VYVFLLLCRFRPGYSLLFCCSTHCWCVNVYCTTATGCQPNCSYHIYIYIYICCLHVSAARTRAYFCLWTPASVSHFTFQRNCSIFLNVTWNLFQPKLSHLLIFSFPQLKISTGQAHELVRTALYHRHLFHRVKNDIIYYMLEKLANFFSNTFWGGGGI